MIKRFLEFIKHGVWQKDESEATSRKERWFVRTIKIIIYTVRGLGEHNIAVRAAALTFFTLMSLVPIAALIFAILKGFGLETNLTEYLYAQFPQYTMIVDQVMEFANNMLMRTKGSVLAISGLVVLFWAVVRVFGNVEKAFNNIWEIKKERSMARKFSDYVTVVFIAPILWITSSSLVLYLREKLTIFNWEWAIDILFGFLSLIVLWLMFAFIYYVLPNTKVKFKGALVAAVIAGTVFQIFQFGYFYIQGSVTNYNVIYGSFAALPLFLIWLQSSWIILLFGAELSFAYQNINNYEIERESLHICYDRRRKIMLATMLSIADRYVSGKGPVKSEDVAGELDLPVRIVRDVIFDLERAGLIVSVNNGPDDRVSYYLPSRDVSHIRIFDIIDGVETTSTTTSNSIADFEPNEKLRQIGQLLDNMKKSNLESQYNIPITELINGDQPSDSDNRQR